MKPISPLRSFMLLTVAASCAGPRLDATNLQTIQSLWAGVRTDATRAATTDVERILVAEMDAAVVAVAGPSTELWTRVKALASRGIDVWEGVDAGVQDSARERLRLLGEAVSLMSRNR